jgi:cell division GTPase FtsZ
MVESKRSKTRVAFFMPGNAGVNICRALLGISDPGLNPHMDVLVTNSDSPQLMEVLDVGEASPSLDGASEDFFPKWREGDRPRLQVLDLETPTASGLGGNLELGRQVIEKKRDDFVNFIEDRHLIVGVTGLGGATGAVAMVFMAELAKELEIPMLCIHTMPASWEMGGREERARKVSKQLHELCTNITLFNDQIPDDFTFDNAWDSINKACPVPMLVMLYEMTQKVGNIINNDASDLRSVLDAGKYGYFGFAKVPGGERNMAEIAKTVLENPYQNHNTIKNAVKFQMVARGKSLTIGEYKALVVEIERRIGRKISDPQFDMKPGIRTNVKDDETWISLLAVAAISPDAHDGKGEREESEIIEIPAPSRILADVRQTPKTPAAPSVSLSSLTVSESGRRQETTKIKCRVKGIGEQDVFVTFVTAQDWNSLRDEAATPEARVRADRIISEIHRQTGVLPEMPKNLQDNNGNGKHGGKLASMFG